MRAIPIALIAVSFSMASVAAADAPTQSERDVARAIAQIGAGYFDDGDWERAREHFHRAYDLVKAPTLALMEARALVKLGHFVEATEAYARAMNVGTDEASEPFRKAAAEARTESSALQRRVPSVAFTIRSEDAVTAVRLDGQVLSKDMLRSGVPLNPGTHVIAVTRRDSAEGWETVTVREGEKKTIAIEPPLQQVADRALPSSHSSLRPFMWTAFATGGAGLAVGVVTGALAADRKTKLDEMCNGRACPPGAAPTLDSYDGYRTTSTVGYVAGFVGVATGTVLLVVSSGGSSTGSTRRTQVGTFVSPTQSGFVVQGGF
jgi:hypothetical protein